MPPSPTRHPAVVEHELERAEDLQLRVADAITRFAGSMGFVYVHMAAFLIWMLIAERNPWPTLTLVVSLEAIFLSTFVMIGQNRQAELQKVKADHDFVEQELELKTNTQLTREIESLVVEVKRLVEHMQPPGSSPG
jgi:uncharacterized membrane protein